MKSQIRVSFDFENQHPVININLDKESEDLADTTLRHFIQQSLPRGAEVIFRKDGEPQLIPIGESTIDPLNEARSLTKELINGGYLNADQGDKIDDFFKWIDEERQK